MPRRHLYPIVVCLLAFAAASWFVSRPPNHLDRVRGPLDRWRISSAGDVMAVVLDCEEPRDGTLNDEPAIVFRAKIEEMDGHEHWCWFAIQQGQIVVCAPEDSTSQAYQDLRIRLQAIHASR